MSDKEAKAIARTLRVLNREDPIDAIGALINSVSGSPMTTPTRLATIEGPIAIAFDTNAVFRVANSKKGPDTVDYLDEKHSGPIILPGQVIQEVWNNQLAGIGPLARTLQKKFEEVISEANKLDENFGEMGEQIQDNIKNLVETHSQTYDPASVSAFEGMLEMLKKRARIPFVPREIFYLVAEARKATKTPPGFKDAGFGDFFVWADFLYGLALEVSPESPIAGAALVTMDQKPDWSRNGRAHPILLAEAFSIIGGQFELWTLEDLYAFVASRS